jgi:3-methyladenine DNA glycosylase AlkD
MITELKRDLKKLENFKKSKILAKFFKTGKGEYGEGDIFLGIDVPTQRTVATKYKDLSFKNIQLLLSSKVHEERLIALLILVYNFQKSDLAKQKDIARYYLQNTKFINNWDLVDLSADKILGEYLVSNEKEKNTLIQLAGSSSVWERRISMIATYAFIKRGFSEPALSVAKILINDKHDLIQKAVGWMLREVGKRVNQKEEEKFLILYYKKMPRTMLRYSIERFPEKLRKAYLEGKV